jgi:hypothetical protein
VNLADSIVRWRLTADPIANPPSTIPNTKLPEPRLGHGAPSRKQRQSELTVRPFGATRHPAPGTRRGFPAARAHPLGKGDHPVTVLK